MKQEKLRDVLGTLDTNRSTDEVLQMVLPLMRQVLDVHEQGRVAPLEGIDEVVVSAGRLWFENSKAHAPRRNTTRIRALQKEESRVVSVVGHERRTQDISGNDAERENLSVGERGATLVRPVYLAGYVSWEHEVEHHDALTDIFVLGLILGSIAFDMDLSDERLLSVFVETRRDARSVNDRIHPVVARVLDKMTELNRHKRAQDLRSVIKTLEHYRDQPMIDGPDSSALSEIQGPSADRRVVLCDHLRGRLFDISKRNKLLYFKSSGQTLNLTETSVPLMLDYRNIGVDDLLTWQGKAKAVFSKAKPIQLGKYLRFEDYPFLPGMLDKLKNQAARDQHEYGFSSLRLVLCFLHWHNLKDSPQTRIHTPLLLLPAELTRKKGVRDAYVLQPTTEVAEVNPVLRHVFRQLYDIDLPTELDLSDEGGVKSLYERLVAHIEASEPGVNLEYVDRPRIDLIQSLVKRRLETFRRRSRLSGRGVRRYGKLDYSYRADNFQPLGQRLFATQVSLSPAPMRDLVEAPRPKVFQIAPGDVGVREMEREQYSLRDDDHDAAPYMWAFDLCSMTLGNFNYQKITLVRDYTALIEEGGRANGAFDSLFNADARAVVLPHSDIPLGQQYVVVPADPSQLSAIARARGGHSFIIQGPPGTGKSQTITNLIADYVAEGKRVLFVCEKRAAIDVVFHRLKQHDLGRLACLIHDSQSDKKALIQDLKESYETWIETEEGLTTETDRENAIHDLAKAYEKLEHFSAKMTEPAIGSEVPLGEIIRRAVALRDASPKLDPMEQERLPSHADFQKGANDVLTVSEALGGGAAAVLSEHPARLLGENVVTAERPHEALREAMSRILPLLRRLTQRDHAAATEMRRDFGTICQRVDFAARVRPLTEAGRLDLLDTGSPGHRTFRDGLGEIATLEKDLEAATERSNGWTDPLPESEMETALSLARRFDGLFFRFLSPAFWQLRSLIHQRYDFARAELAPTLLQALERLQGRYDAQRKVAEAEATLARKLRIEDIQVVRILVERFHEERPTSEAERELRGELIASAGPEIARRLLTLESDLRELREVLAARAQAYEGLSLAEIRTAFESLQDMGSDLDELLSALARLCGAPESLQAAIRQLPLTPAALEAAVCERTVEQTIRGDRTISKLDAGELHTIRQELERCHAAWMAHNAAATVERCRSRFRDHVRITQTPTGGLSSEEKLLKKEYAGGRRDLEHEFGKVMRFKSIRDLMTNRAGVVIRDLKPIWLMSPLSIADTLPCSNEFFDVVIFDEASQIPLEDAVPAIYRAEQCIIVGDQMQLPPTSFFAAGRNDDDDSVVFEENDEEISYELNADSLLSHSARSLPSTMLGWHYRSRDEALIAFCNEAFYGGKLLTIPTPRVRTNKGPIQVATAEDGIQGADELLARPMSFHRLNGVYDNRRNKIEAEYIAEMVRSILHRDTGLSIGIVAFSEAQQGEIEEALEGLGVDDAHFRATLDAEYDREEDDQFCGLFVKNLENVQGDERDIIILSICYGHDTRGRMLMNFGPINKNGGEKRLNVIFSRAKQHMAVVSSIDHNHITNEYNDGANTLRRYLRYAAAQSAGDDAEARRVLSGMVAHGANGSADTTDAVGEALASALRDRGYDVARQVGSSRFRCDLVVRKSPQSETAIAVIIDSPDFYGTGTVDERFRLRPSVLSAFGWQVEIVLGKDWLADSNRVIRRLTDRL